MLLPHASPSHPTEEAATLQPASVYCRKGLLENPRQGIMQQMGSTFGSPHQMADCNMQPKSVNAAAQHAELKAHSAAL